MRQGDKWFLPEELKRDIELHYTSREKFLTKNFSTNLNYTNSKSVAKVRS